MAVPRVITGFSSYLDNELVSFALHVVAGMTGNKNFLNPNPTVVELLNCSNSFSAANANTGDNTREETVIKKQFRAKLEFCLKAMASYVQYNSNNDAAIMLSSGFPLQKERSPVGPLPKPQNLQAKNIEGQIGNIKLTVDVVPKATGYLWKYTEFPITDASIWEIEPTTSADLSLSLKTRTDYVFCVTATGSDRTQTFSDRLTFFVL